jgi:RNA polymerase sigma-70 factor, ECF subfamily
MQPFHEFEQYRPLLFSIAYRMMGTAMEAEDLVQDAYLRYSQANLQEVQSHKYYLTTIVTRLCLNKLQSAQAQREMTTGNWLPEPILIQDESAFDSPSGHMTTLESISLAFLTVLEKLSPTERAVYLLREVFDYGYGEIAEMVEKTEDACRQIYSRAKKHLTANRPRFETDPRQHETLLMNFMQAVASGEVTNLVKLLADDAVMISDGGNFRGKATRPLLGALNVAKFVFSFYRERFRHIPTQTVIKPINGRPSFVIYWQEPLVPFAVISIEVVQGKIQQILMVGGGEDKLKHI